MNNETFNSLQRDNFLNVPTHPSTLRLLHLITGPAVNAVIPIHE